MEKEPLVSATIITYNRPKLLVKAVNSIINQTYKNLEIIISDNCSEDPEVEKVCRELAAKDSRIRYYRQEKNLGIIGNWKFVEQHSTGEYITGISDDDWISENFIEECIKFFLEHPDYTFVSGYEKLYDDDYNLMQNIVAESMEQDSYFDRIESYYKQIWSLSLPGIRKMSDLDKIGYVKDRFGEDWIRFTETVFLGKAKILDNCSYNKLFNGSTRELKDIIELNNLPKDLTFNGLIQLHAETCRDAILHGEFYKERLSEEERIKLAKFNYKLVIEFKATRIKKFKGMLKYIWQHPMFLFKKDFYTEFFPQQYQVGRYMWRHPMFLFRKDFYSLLKE